MFRNYLCVREVNATQTFLANNIAKLYKFPPPSTNPVTVSVLSFGGGLFGTVSPSGVLTGGDVQAYWTSLGITNQNQPKVIIVPVEGATNAPVQGQNETAENTMDVSMVGACCPTSQLTILLFLSPNSLSEFPTLIQKASSPITIDNVVYTPSVVSISWGAPEIYFSGDLLTTINATLANASANGINFCVATGDNGSSDGVPGNLNYVDFPSSSPYVTACGGTTLICPTLNYSDPTTIETAWGKGGGGVSGTFLKPTWQTPVAGATGPNRCLPDVSLVADPATGVEFLIGGKRLIYGGTSIVAPAMAAYYACLHSNTFLLPALYSASVSAPNSFHDITVGSNGSYTASKGFDLCTGFGSIAGDILASQLVHPPATVPVTGITLDKPIVCQNVGQQSSILAVVSPNNATNKGITWTSQDSTIATVVSIACPSLCTRALGCHAECACGCVHPNASNVSNASNGAKPSCGCEIILTEEEYGVEPNATCLCLAEHASVCDSVGLVTGVAAGTTHISATTTDGQFVATSTITIMGLPVNVPVTGVSLNKTFLTLFVGSKEQLVATIAPPNATNRSVFWSSNSVVATVNNTGLVTAHSVGSASILVQTMDGGYTARCLITVTSPLVSITFSPSSITMFAYTTYQSHLVFSPTNANPPVTYTSSSPNVANVSATGLITALSPGTAVIQASAGGKTATLYVYVMYSYLYYATKSTITPLKPRTYSDHGSNRITPMYRR